MFVYACVYQTQSFQMYQLKTVPIFVVLSQAIYIYIYIYIRLKVQENLYKQRINKIISREGENNF